MFNFTYLICRTQYFSYIICVTQYFTLIKNSFSKIFLFFFLLGHVAVTIFRNGFTATAGTGAPQVMFLQFQRRLWELEVEIEI